MGAAPGRVSTETEIEIVSGTQTDTVHGHGRTLRPRSFSSTKRRIQRTQCRSDAAAVNKRTDGQDKRETEEGGACVRECKVDNLHRAAGRGKGRRRAG